MDDVKMPTGTILVGDVSRLEEVPDGKVQQCVSSPPYWKQRSYLPEGHTDKPLEIGSEPTVELYIQSLVKTFRLVRQKLTPSGTLFLNLGDKMDGELLNIPHRVAEALRADGWVWVQTIVWAKPSPLPQSMKGWRWERCRVKVAKCDRTKDRYGLCEDSGPDSNLGSRGGAEWEPCPGCKKCQSNDGWILRKGSGRCTSSHEYIFVMAKSDEYFWDSAAFVEQASGRPSGNKAKKWGNNETAIRSEGEGEIERQSGIPCQGVDTKNPRDVWTIPAEPSKKKHWASYPSELARRAIQAGTSNGGCCRMCRTPYSPVVISEQVTRERPNDRTERHTAGEGVNSCGNTVAGVKTDILGYKQSCSCEGDVAVPCVVLDCFGGTGTTAQVARWMGREWILCELYDKYVDIQIEKIPTDPRCSFKKPGKASKPQPGSKETIPARVQKKLKPTIHNTIPLEGQKELSW